MSDLDTIRERHQPVEGLNAHGVRGTWCRKDSRPWPCDTRVVLDDADRLAEALRYEASVNGITSHGLKALRQHEEMER